MMDAIDSPGSEQHDLRGTLAAHDRSAPVPQADQAALPPRLLHAEQKAFRSLPCRPLAVAWSEHAFEIAFLLGSLVDFAAELDCAATGFAVGAGCAIVPLEPINTTNAVIINVFENLIVTSPV
jgi:hypothetical protein